MVCRELTKTHEEVKRGSLGRARRVGGRRGARRDHRGAGRRACLGPIWRRWWPRSTELVDGGAGVKDACAEVIAANPGAPSRRELYDAVLRSRTAEGVRRWRCRHWSWFTAVRTPATAGISTVDEIRRLAPDLRVLAVDLPGRRGKPGDLADATRRRLGGLGGRRHRRRRTRRGRHRRSFDGGSDGARRRDEARRGPGAGDDLRGGLRSRATAAAMVDTLHGPDRCGTRGGDVRKRARRARCHPVRRAPACSATGCPARGAKFMPGAAVSGVIADPAGECRPPRHARRRTAHLDHDAAGPGSDRVKAQHRCIAALGGVQTLIEIDTCHDLMVSEPERLAEILVERCRAVLLRPTIDAALSRHSCHSASGSESAVMPPPTPSTALPAGVELDGADRDVELGARHR